MTRSHARSHARSSQLSAGQWGSIVGTGLAALGSLYIVIMKKLAGDDDEQNFEECKCPHHQHQDGRGRRPSPLRGPTIPRRHSSDSSTRIYLHTTETMHSRSTDAGNRRKFSNMLSRMSDYIGTPSRKRFDDTEFNEGEARNYPQIPGEETRNRELPQIRMRWPAPSIREQASRSGSPDSTFDPESASPSADVESPGPLQSPQSPSPAAWPTTPRRPGRAATLPKRKASTPQGSTSPPNGPQQHRRDTLEVPTTVPSTLLRNSSSDILIPTLTLAAGHHSPAIVVSTEPDTVLQVSGRSTSPPSAESSSGGTPPAQSA